METTPKATPSLSTTMMIQLTRREREKEKLDRYFLLPVVASLIAVRLMRLSTELFYTWCFKFVDIDFDDKPFEFKILEKGREKERKMCLSNTLRSSKNRDI